MVGGWVEASCGLIYQLPGLGPEREYRLLLLKYWLDKWNSALTTRSRPDLLVGACLLNWGLLNDISTSNASSPLITE